MCIYINIKSLTKGISIAAKSHLILYDQSGKIERNKKLRRRSKEKEEKNKSTHVINCESFNEQSIILTL